MARRSSSPEISLFPFLSILVCLIGALVLLIVIMTIAQSASATAAMSPEDQVRARDAARLRSEVAKLEASSADALKKAGAAAAKGVPPADLKKRDELKTALNAQLAKAPPPDLQQMLDALRRQVADLLKGKPTILEEIEKLKAELAARKKKVDDVAPPLVVQPGGSGMAAGTKLTFIEASSAGLVVHRPQGKPLRVPIEAILTDGPFNEFLAGLPKDSRSSVIFLIRENGLWAYNRGAGWAESQYSLKTAKLPLPGKGVVDLSKFGIRVDP